MVEVIAVIIAAAILTLWIYGAYQSNGSVQAETSWSQREVIDSAIEYFAVDGWDVQDRTAGLVTMRRGVSGCSALLLLIIFFPLGLVYLLTDWGRPRLTVTARPRDGGGCDVELRWRNAPVRRQVAEVVRGLSRS